MGLVFVLLLCQIVGQDGEHVFIAGVMIASD